MPKNILLSEVGNHANRSIIPAGMWQFRAIPRKKITIRDVFVVSCFFFVTNHDMNFFSFSLKKIKSWLDICLIKALRNPHRTNGIRRPVWGHGRLCFVRQL